MYNKKDNLLPEAERLFVYEYLPAAVIARQLNLSRKTVNTWRAEHEWDKKRTVFLKSKMSFHEEMFEFARKIMRSIDEDMKAGETIDPARMNALCRFIPLFTTSKKYEDAINKRKEKNTLRGLTADTIAQIEEEVLGITPNVDYEEETEEE